MAKSIPKAYGCSKKPSPVWIGKYDQEWLDRSFPNISKDSDVAQDLVRLKRDLHGKLGMERNTRRSKQQDEDEDEGE